MSSIVCRKKSFLSMPVGRVKARSPLGHSGQRRLHDVVGSKDTDIGYPHCSGFLVRRVSWYEAITLAAFHRRRGVSLPARLSVSLKLKYMPCKDSRRLGRWLWIFQWSETAKALRYDRHLRHPPF